MAPWSASRNSRYDKGVLRVTRLLGPVVSVGNISVGGSGKTPFTILLGELLKQRGVTFDVISRGYGRKTRGVLEVMPGWLCRDFGDEPLLIARSLKVPVIVGEKRIEAGQYAEGKYGPRLHLLDDAFQHRQLARDFDIVMVSPEDLADRLLPLGRLREPVSSLQRADALVVPVDADASALSELGKPVWRLRRTMILPDSIPAKVIAFCGIARPERFFGELDARGVEADGRVSRSAITTAIGRRIFGVFCANSGARGRKALLPPRRTTSIWECWPSNFHLSRWHMWEWNCRMQAKRWRC